MNKEKKLIAEYDAAIASGDRNRIEMAYQALNRYYLASIPG